jgi:hypothetical protein
MSKTRILAAVVLSTFSAAMVGCDDDDFLAIDEDATYSANLNTAALVVQPVGTTTATGVAALVLQDRILTVGVEITGDMTSGVVGAAIHGPAGLLQDAPIVLDLTPQMAAAIAAGATTGTIVTASYDLGALPVTAAGELRINPNALVRIMNLGRAYVSVSTVANPGGELRGQIRRN